LRYKLVAICVAPGKAREYKDAVLPSHPTSFSRIRENVFASIYHTSVLFKI
jgi:hypothetical protein